MKLITLRGFGTTQDNVTAFAQHRFVYGEVHPLGDGSADWVLEIRLEGRWAPLSVVGPRPSIQRAWSAVLAALEGRRPKKR